MHPRRQALLGAGAAGILLFSGLAAVRKARRVPEGQAIASAPGFRRIVLGGVSPAQTLLSVGLDPARDPARRQTWATHQALASALFSDTALTSVPVALFSDFRCPTCPDLSAALAEQADPPLAITYHEWPILGPRSELAARAALAAGIQGKHPQMHHTLMRHPLRPSENGIAEAAMRIGLDSDRLIADMSGAEVTRQLAITDALAHQFGLFGTPSVVIGRVVVSGSPPGWMRRALIRQAAEDTPYI